MVLLDILYNLLIICGIGFAFFSTLLYCFEPVCSDDDFQMTSKIVKENCLKIRVPKVCEDCFAERNITDCRICNSILIPVSLFVGVLMTLGVLIYVLAFGLSMLYYLKKLKNAKLSGYLLQLTTLCLAAALIEHNRYCSFCRRFFINTSFQAELGWISVAMSTVSSILQFYKTKSEYESL
ncbi:uncharacterized protein LOC105849658 isoform X1 [Hydra vulgaris]|uniref:uncharacterized protein LOC105849658 isoform X1 n=1 Tax=Hydra vulgaris TaxID=6087 RepID=UPI00064110AC|nr:uncharacterized protein LOC105849658 isoform X1 [Hydra vulgaris]